MKTLAKILAIVLIFNFAACDSSNEGSGDKKNRKPNKILASSSGKVNEMVVVIDHELWKGEVGNQVREIFAKDIVGLPQPEALYRIINVAPVNFNNIFKGARNILIVQKVEGEKAKLDMATNVYAMPQVVETLQANSDESLIASLKKMKETMVSKYKEQDLHSVQSRYKKIARNDIADFDSKGISIILPNTYLPIEHEGDFWWYRSDIKEGKHYPSLNFMLYITPMEGEFDLSGSKIISTRDSISKRYIQGPVDGTYMQTETRAEYAPKMFNTLVGEYIAIETRGLWRIEGDFMGGPFINYTIFDEKNKRVITAEGFIYAAGVKKRDYMFEMEAIIKSLKLK